MQQRTVVLIGIIVFVLIIAGMFTFAFLKRQELMNEPAPNETPVATTTPYDSITRVDAKHFVIDGTHTLAGEIVFPTACDLLESSAVVRESAPEQVTVDFTVINNSENCTQALTAQRFMVSFDASENASIDARLNGRSIELNLVPPAPGETPDDFELYIKG